MIPSPRRQAASHVATDCVTGQAKARPLLNGIARAVAVAAATTVWSGLNSKASRNTMSPSRWTTPPLPTSRPGLTGRRRLTLSCKVV